MNLGSRLLAASLFSLVFALPAFAADFVSDEPVKGLIKENALRTDHFQIEFADIILNQADSDRDDIPDVVETVAESAEEAWDLVIEDLRYEKPTANRDILIILDDTYEYLDPGVLGITSVLSNGDPFVAVDPWVSEDYLTVTTGHEFFHTVQFGYGVDFAYTYQGINWAEETAVWIEDLLFDSINDYVNYMPDFFDYPDYSVFASIVPSGTLFEYGLVTWPRFLSEYYSDDIVKDIWETYFESPLDYEDHLKLFRAVEAVVRSAGGDLKQTYQDFALWNLALTPYEEGESYPSVFMIPTVTFKAYEQVPEEYAPALYGSNYLYFPATGTGQNFYFHLIKAEGVSYAVSLVPVDAGNYDLNNVVSTQVDEEDEMSYLSIRNVAAYDGVVAVVSSLEVDFSMVENSGVFDQGYLYSYLASYENLDGNFLSLMDTAAGELVPPEEVEEKPGEGAEFNEGGSAQPILTLSVVTYNEASATFSWKRLNDPKVEGYVLKYGTKSGQYPESVSIDTVNTTRFTLNDLELGTPYYFQLVAVDEKGFRVGEKSQEVVVTPAPWIFKDVSFTDRYYKAIASLTDLGVFRGYEDGTFRIHKEINRAELLKILIEGRGLDVNASVYKNCFPDVREEWFAPYVCYAKSAGWVQGYEDSYFRPGNSVNKVEALKILFKVYEVDLGETAVVAQLNFTDLDPEAWYAIYVWKASVLGILEEPFGGQFTPAEARTRGEMAEELYRYLVVQETLKE